MAWVAEHKLAAAVSNAGGLGIIGAASAPPEVVREEIRKCKELTDKPFGVNIMLLNPNAEEVAKIVVEEGVQAVTTGAGNPGNSWICGKCRSEGHPGGGKCSYGEDDGAGRSRRRSGGRYGERRTYRFYHNHGTGAAGGGCGVYPGDRSRRYRRWQRHGGGIYAGGRGNPDGNPVRSIEGIYCP